MALVAVIIIMLCLSLGAFQPHHSHGNPPKEIIYNLMSKLLDCRRDKNCYLELWKELDDFRSEPEQARH